MVHKLVLRTVGALYSGYIKKRGCIFLVVTTPTNSSLEWCHVALHRTALRRTSYVYWYRVPPPIVDIVAGVLNQILFFQSLPPQFFHHPRFNSIKAEF